MKERLSLFAQESRCKSPRRCVACDPEWRPEWLSVADTGSVTIDPTTLIAIRRTFREATAKRDLRAKPSNVGVGSG